jgi:AcrR family transcriptional regulator
MTAESGAGLRADARRNRDQIIAAAKIMFAEAGPDVPMEEIARRAGVGVGTLYRRFPARDALIRAVVEDSLRVVLDDVRAAAAEEPSAWEALARLMGRSRDIRLGVRLALLSPQTWKAIRADPQTQRFRTEFLSLLDGLVRDAQADGDLRADEGTGDVAALLSLLFRPAATGPDEMTEMILERALVLMLDGLRANPGSPLPGRAISVPDLKRHHDAQANPTAEHGVSSGAMGG